MVGAAVGRGWESQAPSTDRLRVWTWEVDGFGVTLVDTWQTNNQIQRNNLNGFERTLAKVEPTTSDAT